MAAETHSSTRRHVLGAAVALPVLALLPASARLPRASRGVIASGNAARQSSPAHALWDRRLARYRRLHTLWKAEAKTGAFRAANDDYKSARAALIARFGSWEKARRSRAGKPLCTAAFAQVSKAEDVYYDRRTAPLNRAARCLIRTPAPELHALLTKIDIIREHELETHDDMRRAPIDLLRDDVERLGKEWLSGVSLCFFELTKLGE